jgi:hypothetical protein
MPDATQILSPAAQREWPAPYDYTAFEARVAAARRRMLVGQRVGVAALAAVTIAVLSLLLVSSRQRPALAIPALAIENAAIVSTAAYPGDAALQTVMDESWLRHLPLEPAIARVSTRAPVGLLEDRIAWLDDSMSAALQEQAALGEVLRLRSERARLVDALVRVRYAEQLSVDAH